MSFDAGASSDNVGIVTYKWNLGDGTTATGKTMTHTYNSAGNYTVTLTVKDAAGNAATNSITITVFSAEGFPLWVLGAVSAAIALAVIGVAYFLRARKKH